MMRLFRYVCLLAILTASCRLFGQTRNDEEAVRNLPRAFCDAWAKHDAHEMANMVAPDVDFVTVGATWLHGRADFEKYHTRLLSGRFKASSVTLIKTELKFLRPDIALVHWSWTVEGDKNSDGTPRPRRYGMMLMVAEKRHDNWLVVAAQNTNHMPGSPPEMQGINSPIEFPETSEQP
jgi:uncharacterized protein (TIGR02246 family)